MRYLGIEADRPRVAVVDLTGCEGCQLQLANHEEALVAFLAAIDLVDFRELGPRDPGPIDLALVDGAVTTAAEDERLQRLRRRSKRLVALGSCACFGGVNRMRNAMDLEAIHREVYGRPPAEAAPTRPVSEVVSVDLTIPGCPVNKGEVEAVVLRLIWGAPVSLPVYPVCVECKQSFTLCRFDLGELCLGPISRAGCGAPCPRGGLGCWGCRGPAEDASISEFLAIARRRGFAEREINERLGFFGGFEVRA